MKTAFKIVLWGLIGITAGLAIWVVVDGFRLGEAAGVMLTETTSLNYFLYWTYGLLAIAAVSLVYAAITNIVCNPSGWIKTLIGVGSAALVAGSAVALSVFEVFPMDRAALIEKYEISKTALTISEVGVYITGIVGVATLLIVAISLIFGLVRRVVK